MPWPFSGVVQDCGRILSGSGFVSSLFPAIGNEGYMLKKDISFQSVTFDNTSTY